MKLRRKLLAAGFAFGATALTLTTSTFAWYTAKTEVTAKQVTGRTSAEADTGSILIAGATSYKTDFSVNTMDGYGKEATPVYTSKAALDADTNKSMELVPVSYDSTVTTQAKYLPLSSAVTSTTASTALDKAVYGSYSELNVVEFVLRFRTASAATQATKIYWSKFDLANTASATNYQQVALTNNADTGSTTTGVSTAGAYGVDFRKALKMTITATDMTDATTLGTTVATTVYDFESIGYTGALALHEDVNIDGTNKANALGYLNKVMGYSLSTPSNYLSGAKSLQVGSSLTSETAYSPFSIPTSGYLEVRFTLWLDGWDSYCYDVCRKQGFNLDMSFTTAPTTAVIKEAA